MKKIERYDPVARTDKEPWVALRITEFIIRTEAERLELFRLFLQTTLRRVSPLLSELAAFEGISLFAALALVRPPESWPRYPVRYSAWAHTRSSQRSAQWLRAASSRDAWHFERTFANPGVVIRRPHDPRGRFAIRPCGTVLGFTAAIGPCLLSAFGPVAILKLPDELPETLLASMPGRRLNDVVEHPIFAKRKYVVRRATTDVSDGLPILAFGARTQPFEGPWAGASSAAASSGSECGGETSDRAVTRDSEQSVTAPAWVGG